MLNFFSQTGTPLALSILGAGVVSTLERTIPPGGSLIVETAGVQQEVQAGWVEIRSGSPGENGGYVPGGETTQAVPPTSPVLAFVAFRHRVLGKPDYESSVPSLPAETHTTAFALDNMENYVTSVAVANTVPTPVDVTVTFRDPAGRNSSRTDCAGFTRSCVLRNDQPVSGLAESARDRRIHRDDGQSGRIGAVVQFDGGFTSVPSLSLPRSAVSTGAE